MTGHIRAGTASFGWMTNSDRPGPPEVFLSTRSQRTYLYDGEMLPTETALRRRRRTW